MCVTTISTWSYASSGRVPDTLSFRMAKITYAHTFVSNSRHHQILPGRDLGSRCVFVHSHLRYTRMSIAFHSHVDLGVINSHRGVGRQAGLAFRKFVT